MGLVVGRIKNFYRPVKNFNVEERAFKVISRDKPMPAPSHDKMKKMMDEIRNDPDLLSRGKLDPISMQNLSKVFIKSEGHNTDMQLRSRKLPHRKIGSSDYEYGYEDPKVIPKGKASMRQILEILSSYETKPIVNTPEKLAQDYNLELTDVKNIVKFYKPFQVYIPPKVKQPSEKNPLKLMQKKMDKLKE